MMIPLLVFYNLIVANSQSDSCDDSGDYDRCWKSSNIQIQEGNTFSVSIDADCYNTHLKILAYSLSASYPLSENLILECNSYDNEKYISYSNFLASNDSNNGCSGGSCSFSNILLIDDDDFYQQDNSFDGFDGSLDCKIDTISGLYDAGNGWMEIYCYDTSQTDDPTPAPTEIPTTVNPTNVPSVIPTTSPTQYPSFNPSFIPSLFPSKSPLFSNLPTKTPSFINIPSFDPTQSSTSTSKPGIASTIPFINETQSNTIMITGTSHTSFITTMINSYTNNNTGNNSDSAVITLIIIMSILAFLAVIGFFFCLVYYYKQPTLLKKSVQTQKTIQQKRVTSVTFSPESHVTYTVSGGKDINNRSNTSGEDPGEAQSNVGIINIVTPNGDEGIAETVITHANRANTHEGAYVKKDIDHDYDDDGYNKGENGEIDGNSDNEFQLMFSDNDDDNNHNDTKSSNIAIGTRNYSGDPDVDYTVNGKHNHDVNPDSDRMEMEEGN